MSEDIATRILAPREGGHGPRRTSLAIEVRRTMSPTRQALSLAASIALGLVLSTAILAGAGVGAADLADLFFVQTVSDIDSLRSVVLQAGPFVLAGLGALAAFRARFWNLGLEGQMIWGGIGATFVSLHEIGPESARLGLMIVAAAACAAVWVSLALYLKLRAGVNEIISTLLMNYIAFNFLLHLLYGPWRDTTDGFPHSAKLRDVERLPDLGGFNTALLVGLLAALVLFWLLSRTRFGFYLKFIHASGPVAEANGIPVRAVLIGSVLLSGALAGLAGFAAASGVEGRLIQNFADGYLFSGVLIAFLARNSPLACVAVGILVAMLFVAGQSLQVFYQVPFAMVQLIEAIIVMCVAASEFFVRHRIRIVR